MDKGAWQAPVHEVSKVSDMTERLTPPTSLHDIYIHTHTYMYVYIHIFRLLFHYRLLQDIDYCSLCYTVTTG